MQEITHSSDNRMKFILFTHEFPPFQGGVGTYCVELAQALTTLGHTLIVWAPDYLENTAEEDKKLPFPVRRLHCKGTLKLKDLCTMGRIVYRIRKDFEDSTILLPSVGSQIIFMMARLFRLLPKSVTGNATCIWHGSEIFKFKANKLLWVGAHIFFPHARLLAAASQYSTSIIKTSFLSKLGARVKTLPCACGSWAARDAGAPPDRNGDSHIVRILTLARLHPRKGHMEIIEALGTLPDIYRTKFVYQVAGKGNNAYLNSLVTRCKELDITLDYLGPIAPEDLAATYRDCDIYAMTSITLPTSVEGFGITYLEAGFHSKPVIGYSTGGVREAVIDGQTGIVVEEGDREGLSEALATLIDDQNLREQMGMAGQRHACKFSWENTAKKLLNELEKNPPKN